MEQIPDAVQSRCAALHLTGRGVFSVKPVHGRESTLDIRSTKDFFMKTDTLASTKTIQIDGMHGDTCVQKVNAALKNCPGVTSKSVTVGSAVIEADQAGCDSACAAINKAGYKAHLKSGDKNSDKQNSTDGKMTDGKMTDGKVSDSKMADGKSSGSSKKMADGSDDDQGSGYNQKSHNDHANAGNANKAVEPKTGSQSNPAKSH